MESKLANLEQRTEFYRKKWLEEIARADLDALTNLPNRGAYDKRFNEEFKRWLRHPDPLCIAVIDVDHFKKINDKYGHSVGDKTLQIVAKTLRTSLRETDFLARYGGEEFVCLMINTDATNMLTPLEKLRKAVSSIPFKVKNDRLNITVSVGVTMLVATDNVHTAFDRADKALYEAKDAGRNRICYKK
ncbi:GGDEF domain-containing protein [Psychrosphaera algicola]|uniref:diguanylate cyclase n=2 Tax=Psychrosphaera TaxID=907197 RepID=A0ABT5F8T2_9GAMM|nr:GGDEF domain-containing protein [Psychrosphaera sp. G1-22]MDC2887933.1 GGDEF domain-containing protein [Psychrosphaera sp. G1-22]